MISATIHCPMCAAEFDPKGRSACGSCPLSGGCQLVCCPSCGYTSVNPAQSRLARWAAPLFEREPPSQPDGRLAAGNGSRISLAEVPVGEQIEVVELTALPADKRQHLQAYGVTPGAQVEILQQAPLTIFRAENTELALERSLARAIRVRQPAENR